MVGGGIFFSMKTLLLAGFKCSAVAIKCLPVLQFSAVYILWPFGVFELILSHFENIGLLKLALEGISIRLLCVV